MPVYKKLIFSQHLTIFEMVMVQNVKNGITGKRFVYIKNMYQGIKSLISTNGISNFISYNVGVRQGENLSPFLLSLYISDQ